ncbi:NUDIX hydrolase [Fulvivirgaceae bacterium BMA12]|uniref:NUDIX hydrolase n=1 Tax=Agaribacillus aureus TaxID=3051825 RepID=A0ABT8L5W7_9BACT|nr:NUDIX hydrolase [Fulvivirgaceae bacterium BMA12]
MPYQYEFPRPAVTVDCALFRWQDDQLSLLLIKRAHEPFKGYWAFPGGFVDPDEALEVAAKRELLEETGLTMSPLRLFGAFGDPGRDPRGNTITLAYYAVVGEEAKMAKAGSDAKDLSWVNLDDIDQLAFDHRDILSVACKRLKDDIRLSLSDKTTLFDLTAKEQQQLLTILSR